MPYLEVDQGNQEEVEVKEEIEAPDLLGKSIEEAGMLIKENEMQLVIENETEEMDKKNTIVKNQIPKAGIKVKKGSNIYVEYE